MESNSRADSVATMNNGSIVGLPNSSEEEDSSGDELARAGDVLCRTLLQEQDEKAKSFPAPAEVAGTELSPNNHNPEDDKLEEVETNSTPSSSRNGEVPSKQEETNRIPPAPYVPVRPNEIYVPDLSLEDRVEELETKLATLSRILQKQQRLSVRNLLAHSPTGSQRNILQNSHASLTAAPDMPLMEDIIGRNSNNTLTYSPPTPQLQSRVTKKGMVPYLESPAPIDESSFGRRSLHQRKRLSFHLLYDGNEDNLVLADDDIRGHLDNLNDIKPPFTDATDDINSINMQPDHAIAGSNDNNQSEESFHETLQDTVQNDASTGPTSGQDDPSSSVMSSPRKEQGATSTLSHVAARVVSEQNKTAVDPKEDPLISRSPSLDESEKKKKELTAPTADSNTNSNKKQPTTPVSNRNSPRQKEQQLASTSPSILKAAIPPLLLSKDTRSNWLDHLNSFQESHHDVDRQMQEFIKVPGAVERTLNSGLLICVDSFLYVWTILPIRFAWSCVLLSLHYFFKKRPGKYQFHRRHSYQLIQVSIIFFTYRYILLPISIGKLYHWIRGQHMLKLYVLMAMVEVFDRLMCSLGQDCLDSLYWNTTRRPRSSRMLISVSVVVVYTAVHSLILFVHVATLNVAMNSADEALLALLIGGNFAEIKSTVFKKYNKASLFKIVASDICERFKLALFLGVVLMLNFCQGMDSRKMSDYQRIAGIVWMSELLCDWLKHAFITKFNFIPSTVYPEYGLLLAGDVTGIGHEGVNLDHSHAVVKRIGFAQMPLVCVTARLVREAVKYMSLRFESQAVPSWVQVLAGVGCWILLLIIKIVSGAYLQRTSLAKLHAAPELSQAPLKPKQK